MPIFVYQAIDNNGHIFKGSVNLENEQALYQWLKSQGLTLVNVRKKYFAFLFKERIKQEILIEFSRQMYYILHTGIPILQGLTELKQMIKNHTFKEILETIILNIQAGQSLSEALSHYPHLFPPFYTAVIKAGEASGNLDKSFWELTAYLEWMNDLKNKIKQAFIYPAIVSILILIALIIFITFVIPKLVKFLKELNMPLPLPTKLLILFNNLIVHYWFLFLGIILAFIVFIFISRYSERMLFLWDKYKLKLPYLGSLFLNLAMVRLLKYLGMLYRAGIQIYETFDIVKEIVDNKFFAQKIKKIKQFLAEGEPFSEAIALAGDFPPLIIRGVKVGESTGKLDETFEELVRCFNNELDRDVKKVTSILEPILLILVAIMILTIVIAVLWPIYNMLSNIK